MVKNVVGVQVALVDNVLMLLILILQMKIVEIIYLSVQFKLMELVVN